MKFLGLVEQDLDVVSKEYVDKKISSLSVGEESAFVKRCVKIDLESRVFLLHYKNSGNMSEFKTQLLRFFGQTFTKDGDTIGDKYGLGKLTSENLSLGMVVDIICKERYGYVHKRAYALYIK